MPLTNPTSYLRLLYLMHSPVEVTLPNGEWGYACDICGNYGFICGFICGQSVANLWPICGQSVAKSVDTL